MISKKSKIIIKKINNIIFVSNIVLKIKNPFIEILKVFFYIYSIKVRSNKLLFFLWTIYFFWKIK